MDTRGEPKPQPDCCRKDGREEKNETVIVDFHNDRGPFIDGRIIDLSAGAAKKLDFYNQGTVRVLVEAVNLEG